MVVYSALPDEHSTTILVSNAIQEITGYSADEFYKKPELWEEIIHDDDKERVWKAIQKHRTNKIPLKLTYRVITKYSDIKWLKEEAIPVLDQNKQIIRIDGYLEDITQLKKISEQIQYQSKLVDNVSDAIISTDLDFKILSWNAAAKRVYGWTEKEVIGERFLDVVKPVPRKGGREKFLKKFFTTGHWTGELIQKNKNGDELAIQSSISYIKDNSGNTTGIVTVNRDATQFKKAEKKIEDVARFPSQNPFPVLRLDKEGTILHVNNAGKKFIRSWKKNDGYQLPTLLKKTVSEVSKSKKIKQVEFSNENKTLLLSIVPIVGKDYVNIYGMDITKEVEYRNALQKSETRYRQLFEDDLTGDFIATKDGRILVCNPAFVNIFGFSSREEAIGSNLAERHFDPDEFAEFVELIQKNKVLNHYEADRLRCDGTIIHVIENLVGTFDEDGKLIQFKGYIHDDTERKKAEKALEQSKERLSKLYHSMNEGLCVHEIIYNKSGKAVEYKILDVNPMYEKITGLKKKNVIGKLSTDAYQTAKPAFLETYAKVAKTGMPETFETYFSPMKKYFNISVFSPEKGKFATAFMDITKQKKSEEALRAAKLNLEVKVKERTAELEQINKRLKEENQKRLQALKSQKLEEARLDALFQLSQLSEASIYKITNITLENAISLTQSKIGFIGMLNEDETIYTLHSVSKNVTKDCNVIGDPVHWPVSDAGIWADAIRERKTLIVNNYSKPNPRKKGIPKGHLTLKRFMIVPIFEDKKIVAVAGVANKTSDYDKFDERQIILLVNGMWGYVQKNRSREELQKAYDKLEEKVKQRTAELEASNQALQKSEERYRLAQKAAEIGSWDLNIHTGDLEWSETIEPIFGFQKGEFGKTYEAFLDCVHPDDRQFVIDSVNACLKNDVEYDIEHRILWPDGSIHWVRETGDVIYDEKGKPIRMLGIVQDITDRKKSEENIKKLNENLVHHTTELAAINKELEAFSYSASHDLRAPLRSIDGFSQALLEDYADKLDRDGRDYIARVRNASQHMGRIIDDLLKLSRITRHPLEKEEVNLADLSRSIFDELKKENAKRKITFDVSDDLIVIADRHLLHMALENLIGNAWKFTSKNPKAKITIGKTKQKGQDVFFIQDNGAGFDMKYVDKLFTPFQRLHSDNEFPGIGIGLGIVSRIIHRHGGSIWAESEVGKGATFYFTLGGMKYV